MCWFPGTIPPLLKTGDPISGNMSGSGGLKMVVTITSILVVAILVFIMLMVLKRRRREQRLKRLRGGLEMNVVFCVTGSGTGPTMV